MTVPGKLTVDKSGRLRGPATITYNDPFPCVNGRLGVTGKMRGAVQHTMVGTLAGTIAIFNDPARGASATVGIAQGGRIHQFGPLGVGWEAWHAYAANLEFYGIEFEDDGNPDIPISDKALTAGAQVLECLSAFAGFPLRVLDDCTGSGFGYHSLCASWNLAHHTCPDLPPRHVRSRQRAAIVDLARQIRAGTPPPPFPPGRHAADGTGSLAGLAARQGTDVAAIWHATFAALTSTSQDLGNLQRAYLNAGQWDHDMPKGMILWLP